MKLKLGLGPVMPSAQTHPHARWVFATALKVFW